MKKILTTYYKLPVASIPFKEIPSLEYFIEDYIYCSSFPLVEFMKLDYHMLSVYKTFDKEIGDINSLKKKELLFGQVVSDQLPTRGKSKCLKLGTTTDSISKEQLPHLKYNSSGTYDLNGNWFYMKDGDYVILSGIRSEFEKVKHLEGIAIYGDNIVRLRVVMELLKKNAKEGLVKLSTNDYREIAYKVLKTDPTLLKSDDDIIRDGVDNWLPSMLLTPLYEDIPIKNRGKAVK